MGLVVVILADGLVRRQFDLTELRRCSLAAASSRGDDFSEADFCAGSLEFLQVRERKGIACGFFLGAFQEAFISLTLGRKERARTHCRATAAAQ